MRLPDYPFPWRYPGAPLPVELSRLSEEKVQADIVRALQAMGVVVWPVDVGARKVRGRAVGMLRRAGVADPAAALRGRMADSQPGFCDLPGVIPVRGLPFPLPLYLEVKAPAWKKLGKRGPVGDRDAGEPTDDQLAFLLEAHHAGAVAAVVWSVREAVQVVSQALQQATEWAKLRTTPDRATL